MHYNSRTSICSLEKNFLGSLTLAIGGGGENRRGRGSEGEGTGKERREEGGRGGEGKGGGEGWTPHSRKVSYAPVHMVLLFCFFTLSVG
jgi:hypothetical protein